MTDNKQTTNIEEKKAIGQDMADKETTYDHVLKYTGLFGGVQGLTLLMGMARNKLVALLIGPAGLGFINMYNTVASLIHQSTNLGIGFSAVRHISELSEQGEYKAISDYAKTIRTWSLLTAIFGTIICCILSHQISFWSFENYDYTLEFCLLSPIIGFMAITAGELAIMKGLKQLKKVAMSSACGALATLIVCIPIYSLLGISGIVTSLLLCNLASLVITLFYSLQVIPWRVNLKSVTSIIDGIPMVKLGIGYIIAGIFGQGAEYIIRTLIQQYSDIAHVGLYNSGYIMMVSYASMVFVAMEADFFPRLSAACNDTTRSNKIINQQMEICVLLIAPILICFVLSMPYMVKILYSDKFMAAVPMSISATLFMFFRALTLPVAYLPLAKGDSKMFMATELFYDIFIAVAVPFAFKNYGLLGAGWAISTGGFMYFVIIHILYRFKYRFIFSPRLLYIYISQFVLLIVTITIALYVNGSSPELFKALDFFYILGDNDTVIHSKLHPSMTFVKWGVGLTTLSISVYLSLRILRRETNIISTIKTKIKSKIGAHE